MQSAPDTSVGDSLDRLGADLGVQVGPAVASFCESFRGHLEHFAEVGVLLDPPSLAVVTLGRGRHFGERVAAWMREVGFEPALGDHVLDMQETIDEWMLVRVVADGRPTPEVGLYFRRALEVGDAVRWLEARGVSGQQLRAVQLLADLTGARCTGILGSCLRVGRPVVYKIYLHVLAGREQPLARSLTPVFEEFKVEGGGWRRLLDGLDAQGDGRPTDVYVSLSVGDGDAFESVKLDMFSVDLEALSPLLQETGAIRPDTPSPLSLARDLGLHTAEHCGLRFRPDGCEVTLYFVPPRSEE